MTHCWVTRRATRVALRRAGARWVQRTSQLQTLVIVAENDDITLWEDEIGVYNAIPTNRKKLVVIPESDHLALHSKQTLLEQCAAWVSG
jgi:uncharacterized protein